MDNVKLTEKALEYLETTEAFVSKEVPIYIQELLNFKIFEHLVAYFDDFLVTVPLAIIGIFLYLVITKWLNSLDKKSYNYRSNQGLNYGYLIVFVIPLIFSIGATNHLIQAYKAYKAPRVYLIEYFNTQLNKGE